MTTPRVYYADSFSSAEEMGTDLEGYTPLILLSDHIEVARWLEDSMKALWVDKQNVFEANQALKAELHGHEVEIAARGARIDELESELTEAKAKLAACSCKNKPFDDGDL
jgi:hypothetical protein